MVLDDLTAKLTAATISNNLGEWDAGIATKDQLVGTERYEVV